MLDMQILVGLPLSIVSRAVDMLILDFGALRSGLSIKGVARTVCEWSLHIQCPWRLDDPQRTITGSADLREYGGEGEEPEGWDFEAGSSVQDVIFERLFRTKQGCYRVNDPRFLVRAITQSPFADLVIAFDGGHLLTIFPAGTVTEAWRLFAPGQGGEHLVFPRERE